MDVLKIVLTIVFVIDCIALAAIILLQEGKSAGLGTISGGQIHTGDTTRGVLWRELS